MSSASKAAAAIALIVAIVGGYLWGRSDERMGRVAPLTESASAKKGELDEPACSRLLRSRAWHPRPKRHHPHLVPPERLGRRIVDIKLALLSGRALGQRSNSPHPLIGTAPEIPAYDGDDKRDCGSGFASR